MFINSHHGSVFNCFLSKDRETKDKIILCNCKHKTKFYLSFKNKYILEVFILKYWIVIISIYNI